MMIDRRPQFLEIAPCHGIGVLRFGIFPAQWAVDIGEGVARKEGSEPPQALDRLAGTAELARSIEDEPSGGMGDTAPRIPPFRPEPQSRSSGTTRHNSLIRSMLADVV